MGFITQVISYKIMSQSFIKLHDDAVDLYSLNTFRKRCCFGLCCINNSLRDQKKIFCSRSCIQKNFTVEKAKTLALQNVADIIPLINWNKDNNIKHLRLSSDMFPHFTNPNTEKYSIDFAVDALQKAGTLANSLGHRITMHPGQFCVIGAKDPEIFQKTSEDLSLHADILDNMGIDHNGILCIHGGGTYGDKESAKRRWIQNFDDLPRKVKSRICIENCEKSYSLRDCIEISEACNIPVILDSHHYNCYDHFHPNETQEPVREMLDEVIESWGTRTPLMHVSDQKEGAAVGAHHDYVQTIPDYMIEIPDKYNTDLSIEVEAKAKEAAIAVLQKRYKM
jgi:UV DNA damage endonuclease